MKKLTTLLTISTLALGLSTSSFAAEKKAKPAAETPATGAKPAAEKVAGEAKPIPMNSRADSIDAKAKTFSMKRKDGVEVKHVVTATTTIKNGEAAAKFEDIKVGEYVSGLRLKKSDTEYEVVKITKFGPRAEKKEGDKKAEGAKKADAKKANE